MKKINIGVLGCAAIAQRSVIPAILQLPEHFNLVAVASRDLMKATAFSQEFGCEAIGSYEEMINRNDIEALYVPLPTGLHNEWVNKALEHGKHVYAEKSLSFSLMETEGMVRNARKNELALMEGFMFQYHQQHVHFKQLLHSGVIGDIRHFRSAFGFPPLPPDNFRYDPAIGGGALYDVAAYPVRAAFFMLGSAFEVSAASVYRDPAHGTSLYGSAFMKGPDGIGASLSFGFDNFYQCYYQFWGSKGKLTAEKAFTPRPDQTPVFVLETNDGIQRIESTADNHFINAMKEFHQIISEPELREKHFREITEQSKALDAINHFSL